MSDARILATVAAQRNRLWALLIDIERACEVNRPDLVTQVAGIAKQREAIVPGHEPKKADSPSQVQPETRITMEIELTERNVLAIEAALARARRRG